jgi:TolA-binding protein
MTHPSDASGEPIHIKPAAKDPENGFTQDEAIQNFRQAMILYQGQKYPESVLAFSKFLEKYADHPFAGSAQFYVAESYMKQKEYKLALQEFQRVLTTYDRSPHISDTLKEMIFAEESLKETAEAGVHKHLLTSLFPSSPAAAALRIESKVANETPPPSDSPPVRSPDAIVEPNANPIRETIEDQPLNPTSTVDQVPTIPPTAPIDGKTTAPQ